jgi:hypothetical protein
MSLASYRAPIEVEDLSAEKVAFLLMWCVPAGVVVELHVDLPTARKIQRSTAPSQDAAEELALALGGREGATRVVRLPGRRRYAA